MTNSINKKECVFVYFETSFRKPVSCHLFPIRISKFGGDILRYEKFSECSPAIDKGKKEDIKIVEFCKDSLVRNFGEKWYSSLMENKGK